MPLNGKNPYPHRQRAGYRSRRPLAEDNALWALAGPRHILDQDAEDCPFLCRPQATMLYHQKRCVVPSRLHSTKGTSSAGCGKLASALVPRPLWIPEFFLQIARKQRADERTRTADLISLQVISHALQGFARDCRIRILKQFSLLRLERCCTVLRSQWCQSGVSRPWITRRRYFCSALSSFSHSPFLKLVLNAADAPRSQPPLGFRLPRRPPALRPAGRCRCERHATPPGR